MDDDEKDGPAQTDILDDGAAFFPFFWKNFLTQPSPDDTSLRFLCWKRQCIRLIMTARLLSFLRFGKFFARLYPNVLSRCFFHCNHEPTAVDASLLLLTARERTQSYSCIGNFRWWTSRCLNPATSVLDTAGHPGFAVWITWNRSKFFKFRSILIFIIHLVTRCTCFNHFYVALHLLKWNPVIEKLWSSLILKYKVVNYSSNEWTHPKLSFSVNL